MYNRQPPSPEPRQGGYRLALGAGEVWDADDESEQPVVRIGFCKGTAPAVA